MRKAILVLLTVFLVGMAAFSADGAGTTGAPFLKIPVGAKAGALGDAVVAAPFGAEAIFWNLGSLGFQKGIHFNASYQDWIADANTQYVGLTYNLDGIGTFGLGLVNLGFADDMLRTTLTDPDGTAGEEFSAGDMALTLAYGRKITDSIGIGVGGKYVSQKIDTETATAFTADIGIRAKFMDNICVGLSVQNLFGEIGYTETFKFPMILRFGLAYKVMDGITGFGQVDYHMESGVKFSVGAEYVLADMIALRIGYKGNTDNEGLTAGVGVKYEFIDIDFSYGIGTEEALSNVMKFSLGLHF
ncbi:PorV/PorQ family protein [bacterium]|nr:PorV/PorQ family protein [bacterium]